MRKKLDKSGVNKKVPIKMSQNKLRQSCYDDRYLGDSKSDFTNKCKKKEREEMDIQNR